MEGGGWQVRSDLLPRARSAPAPGPGPPCHADMTSRSQYVRRLSVGQRETPLPAKQAESVWTSIWGTTDGRHQPRERTLQDHAQWSGWAASTTSSTPPTKTSSGPVESTSTPLQASISRTHQPTTSTTPPPEMKAWHDGSAGH